MVGRTNMASPLIEYPIVMKVGEEAKGNLRSFVEITQLIENQYYSIIDKLIRHWIH